jgi:hypothetical protein
MSNRRERTQESMERKATQTALPRNMASRFFGNVFVQAVAVFIALAVAFSGKLDARGTSVTILLAAAIGAMGIYTHVPRRASATILVLVYGVALLTFYVYLTARPTSTPTTVSETAHSGDPLIHAPGGGWMFEWGMHKNGIAYIGANVEPLLPYKDRIYLILICRVADNTIDEMEDINIEKSSVFYARQPRIEMEMLVTQAFLARAMKAPEQPPIIHAALVSLPINLQPSQIHKLGDVEKIGGNILSINGFAIDPKLNKKP